MRVITHDLTPASRAENGCILYNVAESTEKEGVYTLLMIWRDVASYRQYAASDYVWAFTSNLSAGMLEKPPVYGTCRSLG